MNEARERTSCYGASGRIDVEMDGFLWVIGFEEEELGHDGCGHGFVDFAVETYYSFLVAVSLD